MWERNYDYWVNHEKLDKNIKTQLVGMSLEEKEERFYKNLEFGTAGIRGKVGIGTNRLNVYIIRRINYGFADYLIKNIEGSKDRGIVIAYDNRHESDTFSLESARVLASKGIKVYLFESLRPTPELSFAVRHLNAAGGIVITASHNPPEYNGYKLYNQEGCQLVPNENDKVIECINKIDRELDVEDNFKEEIYKNIHYIGKDIDNFYLSMVKELAINRGLDKSKLKVVFSPQHGTSYEGMKRILTEEGYNLILVKEQCDPDPNFSFTKSPNPENEMAYELAIEYAKKYDGDIIITTDPDGDRLGVMVKDLEGKYQLINGNQLGVILMEYRISQMKNNDMLPEKPYVVTSIVTSEMGHALCKAEGIDMEFVLTGFKYIGDLIHEYEKTDKTFLLGYEESYGYNISDKVRDKDALQAAYVLLEAACYYKQTIGITLVELLNELYKKYGYYYDKLFNFEMSGKDGFDKIAKIMTRVRENPPKELGLIKVVEIQDYEKGYGNLPSADVIKIKLLDRSFVALRPSGTEPKFKLYMSVVGENRKEAEEKLAKIYEDINKYIY